MLAYLLIICVAFLVVAVSMIRMVGEYLFTQKVKQDQLILSETAQYAGTALYNRDAESLYTLVSESSTQNGGRFLITDRYGVVQADAGSEYNGMRLNFSEVARVLNGEDSAYGFYQLSGNDKKGRSGMLLSAAEGTHNVGVYAVSVGSAVSGVIGVMVYMTASEDIYESMEAMQNRMIIWLLLVALVVALTSLLVSRIFTKPIDILNKGIARMAQGELSTRVTIKGNNEFAQLANAFNSMSEKLEKIDQTRTEFVSSASHELKTPLSTIKILSQSILYQDPIDPGMTKMFLTDIDGEIDRMNSTIEDLLTLAQYAGSKIKPRTVKASLDELVSSTAKRLQPVAGKKRIKLDVAIFDQIECLCDDKKLEQVFYNLIDNAIKYTPEEGNVHVEVRRNSHVAQISVTDDGIGIPEKDQPHIFDRFYRVDKARSRATGGTGLGLSIVKQIVLLHKGSITVKSEEGAGSTFTVELPIVNI